MTNTAWTDEQTNALVSMYREGKPLDAIARAMLRLGRELTGRAVASKVKRMGLPLRGVKTWTPEEDARLIELWTTTGETQQQIALIMTAEFPGVRKYDRSAIGGRRHRLGLVARKPGFRAAGEKAKDKIVAPVAVKCQGCKWITNSRALHRQRPHYCGTNAAEGDWCAEHKAVLHGREVVG